MVSRKVRRRRAVALVGFGTLAVWGLTSCLGVSIPATISSAVASFSSTPSPNTSFAPPLSLPPIAPGLTQTDLKHEAVSTLADPAWVAATAQATGIPPRALAAYAGVSLGLSAVKPNCHLSWNTLAGIGWVESRHGTIFGGSITADGTTLPPVFGIPLDGKNSTKAMPDSDGGKFDGTAEFDRAVGPMQFVPRTWATWHTDGNNDGDEDAQDIDDAALAAGRYLCYSGGDLATQDGWQKAIWAYNQVSKYMVDVSNKAIDYAKSLK